MLSVLLALRLVEVPALLAAHITAMEEQEEEEALLPELAVAA